MEAVGRPQGGTPAESGRRRRLQVFAFAITSLILLVGGAAWRWPTLSQANYLRFAAGHLSYSDIIVFYSARALGLHLVPYLQQPLEYPVLIGDLTWVTSFAPGIQGYFLANSVVLILCMMTCFVLLATLDPPIPLSRFALAPALATYTVLNWDALALVGLVAALCLTRARKMGWAGVCVGVGTAAKIFPVFVLPILLAECIRVNVPEAATVRRASPRLPRMSAAGWRLVLGFALVTLVLNLPVALASPRGWAFPYIFQASRDPNIDSVWAGLPHIPSLFTSFTIAVAFVGGSLWFSRKVLENGRWEEGVLLCMLIFYLFTKVYSPQYDLWLAPILALLFCPIGLWMSFVLADFAYYAAVFFYYYGYSGGLSPLGDHAEGLLRTAVWGRELMLIALFVWALTRFYGTSVSASWRRLKRFAESHFRVVAGAEDTPKWTR